MSATDYQKIPTYLPGAAGFEVWSVFIRSMTTGFTLSDALIRFFPFFCDNAMNITQPAELYRTADCLGKFI